MEHIGVALQVSRMPRMVVVISAGDMQMDLPDAIQRSASQSVPARQSASRDQSLGPGWPIIQACARKNL
jgi:hypothetical protein